MWGLPRERLLENYAFCIVRVCDPRDKIHVVLVGTARQVRSSFRLEDRIGKPKWKVRLGG